MKPRSKSTKAKHRYDELMQEILKHGGTIQKDIASIKLGERQKILKKHESTANRLAILGNRKSPRRGMDLKSHTGEDVVAVVGVESKRTVKHLYALSRGLTSCKPA